MIKFSVATNWDHDLLHRLNKGRVAEIYGKATFDPFSGGRPSRTISDSEKHEVAEHIDIVHQYGFEFNYLLNGICLGNQEWTASWQTEARNFIDWLCERQVESVTVSIPYLLQMIKKSYPHLRVNISVYAGINSVVQAKYWEGLGADRLTLCQQTMNRDFKEIKRIRGVVKNELQLIVNNRCLLGCPFRYYHCNSSAHASCNHGIMDAFSSKYCLVSCKRLILSEPWRIFTAQWIRPEDLKYYEERGIGCFKLTDRMMTTDAILSIVNAYENESYDGNLMDLFFSPSRALKPLNSSDKKHDSLQRKILEMERAIAVLESEEAIYINNRRLDGFLNYFINEKCEGDCPACNYCRDAGKFIEVSEDLRKKMLEAYQEYLSELSQGI